MHSLISRKGPHESKRPAPGCAGRLSPWFPRHSWDELHPRRAAPALGTAGPTHANPVPALPGVPKTTPSPLWAPSLPPPREKEHLVLTCLVEEEGKQQAPKHIHCLTAHREGLTVHSIYYRSCMIARGRRTQLHPHSFPSDHQ